VSIQSIASQEACDHREARERTHRCPACGGIMRRCCQSTVLCRHDANCREVAGSEQEPQKVRPA
jgi:hypothetical protein